MYTEMEHAESFQIPNIEKPILVVAAFTFVVILILAWKLIGSSLLAATRALSITVCWLGVVFVTVFLLKSPPHDIPTETTNHCVMFAGKYCTMVFTFFACATVQGLLWNSILDRLFHDQSGQRSPFTIITLSCIWIFLPVLTIQFFHPTNAESALHTMCLKVQDSHTTISSVAVAAGVIVIIFLAFCGILYRGQLHNIQSNNTNNHNSHGVIKLATQTKPVLEEVVSCPTKNVIPNMPEIDITTSHIDIQNVMGENDMNKSHTSEFNSVTSDTVVHNMVGESIKVFCFVFGMYFASLEAVMLYFDYNMMSVMILVYWVIFHSCWNGVLLVKQVYS